MIWTAPGANVFYYPQEPPTWQTQSLYGTILPGVVSPNLFDFVAQSDYMMAAFVGGQGNVSSHDAWFFPMPSAFQQPNSFPLTATAVGGVSFLSVDLSENVCMQITTTSKRISDGLELTGQLHGSSVAFDWSCYGFATAPQYYEGANGRFCFDTSQSESYAQNQQNSFPFWNGFFGSNSGLNYCAESNQVRLCLLVLHLLQQVFDQTACTIYRKIGFLAWTHEDECKIHNGFCHPAAVCSDTPWSGPSCSCPSPLVGNGFDCSCPTNYTLGPCARMSFVLPLTPFVLSSACGPGFWGTPASCAQCQPGQYCPGNTPEV